MKFTLLMISLLAISCGHVSKKKEKNEYSPVVSFQDTQKTYEAKVSLPKGMKDRVPLVIIIHEWWGRNDYTAMRSQMLNDQGFATLAVDLYGNNQVAETPKEAQNLATPFYNNPVMGVEILNRYIAGAKIDPHVDPSKIFVIGYCFGGTQALNLARTGADVAGVVSFHGGLKSGLKPGPIKARVLAINGLADPMVPPKERTEFEAEMKGIGANYQVANFKNATHAFTNPRATELGKRFNIPIAYNQEADTASWKLLLDFLRKN